MAAGRPPRRRRNAERYRAETQANLITIAKVIAFGLATLPNLSPEERHYAELWVEVLNDVSNSFLTDGIPPRLRLGDLAGIIRGA